MLENKIVRGIHISRYIASWMKSGGTFDRSPWCGEIAFKAWLGTLVIDGEHLTEDEKRQICNYADNGKLELETSAKLFLRQCANDFLRD